MTTDDEPLLEVRNLRKYFPVRRSFFQGVREVVRAVDDVSFQIRRGETLGLLGESGSGKTTAGRTLLRLVEPTAGEVLFRTREGKVGTTHAVFRLGKRELRRLRRYMQIVFQDPLSSLNPRLTIQATLEEGLIAHRLGDRKERRRRVGEILERVGLDAGAACKFPHAFSGGQRQRIGIARALILEPAFVVLDEAVSALDASIQAQILNLLVDLQRERNLAYLFIAHDLAVAAHVSHRLAVMHRGRILEMAQTDALIRNPTHPYTQVLFQMASRGPQPPEFGHSSGG